LLIYNRIDEYIFAPNRITLLKKKNWVYKYKTL
jgi:hypothetical protein